MTKRKEQLEVQLYEAHVSGRGMKHVLDTAADVFGGAIVVSDTAFNLIDEASAQLIEDPIWSEIVHEGYCSPETMASFQDEGIIRQINSHAAPVYFNTGLAHQVHRILGKVVNKGRILAYFGIFETGIAFETDTAIDLAQTLSEILAAELRNYTALSLQSNNEMAELLGSIMSGNIESEKEITRRLSMLRRSPLDCYVLMIVPEDQTSGDEGSHLFRSAYLRIALSKLNRPMHLISYQGTLLTIFEARGIRDFAGLNNELNELFEHYDLSLMLGHPFRKVSELPEHYRILMELQNMVAETDAPSPVTKISDHLAQYLVRGGTPTPMLVHPDMRILAEHDRENDSELLLSFYTYLSMNRSLQKSADQLDIHKNTLQYRLKKIRELICFSSPDDDSLFHLLFSYYLLREHRRQV